MTLVSRLSLLAIAVVVSTLSVLVSGTVHAQTSLCPARDSVIDFDADGFPDALECNGLTLADGTLVPLCAAGMARPTCLDPGSKDLFVILVKAVNSLINVYLENANLDPLLFLRRSLAEKGLGITVHRIAENQAGSNREVTPTQKAIRIAESLDTSDIPTGICTQGTPNGLDRCVIYTQRIANFVGQVCSGKSTCDISPGSTANSQGVIRAFITNTIAHEASHTLALTSTYNSRFGGNHYKSGTNVVMDQSVYYTDKGGKVTFFIPGVYADPDPNDARLK